MAKKIQKQQKEPRVALKVKSKDKNKYPAFRMELTIMSTIPVTEDQVTRKLMMMLNDFQGDAGFDEMELTTTGVPIEQFTPKMLEQYKAVSASGQEGD